MGVAMFTWICPQCGREVPPSEQECPDCAARKQQLAARLAGVPGPQPPAEGNNVFADAARRVQAARAPGWLLSIVFAAGFLALAGGVYLILQRLQSPAESAPAPKLEPLQAGKAAPAKASPLTGQIEVTGLRITEDAKQNAQIQYLIVNHTSAEIADLAGNVTLRAIQSKPEDPPLSVFPFKVSSLGPYESKEMKTTVRTKLRAYELPDWQFLKADVEITSP